MPSKAERHPLASLHDALAEALAARDWVRIGQLDRLVRGCLRGLAATADLPEEIRALRLRLKRLHARALAASMEEGARLRGILDQHLHQAEGVSAYRAIDRYRSEE